MLAGRLKRSLEHYGVRAFLAHEDIIPGKKWTNEIMNELKSCDIFVPILTTRSKGSVYVNQEIGFVLAGKAKIIPLRIDVDPFGFISETQGMKPITTTVRTQDGWSQEIDSNSSAWLIVGKIMQDAQLRDALKRSVVYDMHNSRSFEETRSKTRVLECFSEFGQNEVRELASAATSNRQIFEEEYKGKKFLRLFFENHRRYLTDDLALNLTLKGFLESE